MERIMDNKKIFIGIGAGVAILLLIALTFMFISKGADGENNNQSKGKSNILKNIKRNKYGNRNHSAICDSGNHSGGRDSDNNKEGTPYKHRWMQLRRESDLCGMRIAEQMQQEPRRKEKKMRQGVAQMKK